MVNEEKSIRQIIEEVLERYPWGNLIIPQYKNKDKEIDPRLYTTKVKEQLQLQDDMYRLLEEMANMLEKTYKNAYHTRLTSS